MTQGLEVVAVLGGLVLSVAAIWGLVWYMRAHPIDRD